MGSLMSGPSEWIGLAILLSVSVEGDERAGHSSGTILSAEILPDPVLGKSTRAGGVGWATLHNIVDNF